MHIRQCKLHFGGEDSVKFRGWELHLGGEASVKFIGCELHFGGEESEVWSENFNLAERKIEAQRVQTSL